MKNWKVKFSTSTVSFVLDGQFATIDKMVDKSQAIYITDENVHASLHASSLYILLLLNGLHRAPTWKENSALEHRFADL